MTLSHDISTIIIIIIIILEELDSVSVSSWDICIEIISLCLDFV